MKKMLSWVLFFILIAFALINFGIIDEYSDYALFNANNGDTVNQDNSIIKVGDTVFLGVFPQNNDFNQPLEWLILEVKDNTALLITKNVIDCRPFNPISESLTWEKCHLRQWLNKDFYNYSFTPKEQEFIATSHLRTLGNPYYHTEDCADTYDKVFILDAFEADTYFSDNEVRKAEATHYAKKNGVVIYPIGTKRCNWWLRTQGHRSMDAASVDYNGGINYFGDYVSQENIGLRPSIRIDKSYLETIVKQSAKEKEEKEQQKIQDISKE